MGYLICEKCGGYYKLEPGESIDDFEGCECGGKFRFVENLDDYEITESENKIEKDSTEKNIVDDSKSVDEKLSKKPMNGLKCPDCGAENNKDAVFCKLCGYNFNSSSELIKSSNYSPKEQFQFNNKKTKGSVCSKCGEKNVANAQFCAECGTELKKNEIKSNNIFKRFTNWFVKLKPVEKIMLSFGLAALIILISVVAISNSSDSLNSPYTTEVTAESDISYIQSCKENSMGIKHLTKNPEAYVGERCMFEGNIFQIMESGNTTDIILGDSVPTLYVFYGGTTPVVEGDYIAVCGEVYGSYTYTSRANYEITLPAVKAKYVIMKLGDQVVIMPSGRVLTVKEFKNL